MAGLAFSVITTGIFLYPVIDGLLKKSTTGDTIVAITLGSTGIQHDNSNIGGNIPHIAVYSEDGTEIGRKYGSSKDTWAEGTTQYVNVSPNKGMTGKQATYVSVATGGNDAICISAISVAWPDGSTPKVWLGDIGQNCSTAANGPSWANSVTQTGSDPQSQSKCIWIDGDHTSGILTQGIGLHITDFGRTDGATTSNGAPTTNPVATQWNEDKELVCNADGRMKFYKDFLRDDYPVVYQPPLKYGDNGIDADPLAVLHGACDVDPEQLSLICPDIDPQQKPVVNSRRSHFTTQHKRNLRRRSSRTSTTLVYSSNPAHSAEEVCNHPASVSPDFVSRYENKFCDMTTRTVWPLCFGTIASGCFDTSSNRLVVDFKRLNSTQARLEQASPNSNGTYGKIWYW